MEVVGEASQTKDIWPQLQDTNPQILLVDWTMLGAGAGEVLTRLRATHPQMQVVVLSGRLEMTNRALAAGADAFVCKADSPDHLMHVRQAIWERSMLLNGIDPLGR